MNQTNKSNQNRPGFQETDSYDTFSEISDMFKNAMDDKPGMSFRDRNIP